jgi:hypothetical protein
MVGLLLFYRARQIRLEIQAANTKQHKRTSSQDVSFARSSMGGAGGPSNDGSQQLSMHGGSQYNPNAQVYYQSRNSHGSQFGNTMATSPISTLGGTTPNSNNNNHNHHLTMMSPNTTESILSNPSLLSNGQGDDDDDDLGRDDDYDDDALLGGSNLSPLDDFDRYKDQNLEVMRAQVEDNVAGTDGMMSQALTFALMDGGAYFMEAPFGQANTKAEMEANVLCEVTGWMKRHDDDTGIDDK